MHLILAQIYMNMYMHNTLLLFTRRKLCHAMPRHAQENIFPGGLLTRMYVCMYVLHM